MDVLVGHELASLNLQSHLLVSVPERHAGGGKAVHLLHREHGVIHRVVEDVVVDLHLVDDIGSHAQAVVELVEGGQEHLFYYLQVAEIAHGQVVHYHHYLLRQALQLVALGAYQLKHVGVLLVRHDA